jgi:hypothetical protein
MDNPEKLATLGKRRNGMIVEFITTYAINAYHHLRCEFGPRSELCDKVCQ